MNAGSPKKANVCAWLSINGYLMNMKEALQHLQIGDLGQSGPLVAAHQRNVKGAEDASCHSTQKISSLYQTCVVCSIRILNHVYPSFLVLVVS